MSMTSEAAAAKGPLRGHSAVLVTRFAGFTVVPVSIFQDNYCYVLIDHKTREAALVDPADPFVCLRAVELIGGLRLTHVLTTHKHADHSGGNDTIRGRFPAVTIVGGARDNVPAVSRAVKQGDVIHLGGTQVVVADAPGHTRGHVLYTALPSDHPPPADLLLPAVFDAINAAPWADRLEKVDPVASKSSAVFTGDTHFVGGCGRFFEGDAADFYAALVGRLGQMPPSTLLFCGHEYTLDNLAFAAWAEPGNAEVASKLRWARERKEALLSTVPTTVAEENATNPFMRVDALSAGSGNDQVRGAPNFELLSPKDKALAVMARLCELKNSGAHKAAAPVSAKV